MSGIGTRALCVGGAALMMLGCGSAASDVGQSASDEPVDELAQALPPATPTVISPSGNVDCRPNFRWNRVTNATQYQLLVRDSQASPKISRVFTAAEVHCPLAHHPVCDITPTTTLSVGAGAWWVRAGNADGFSSYNIGLKFNVQSPGQTTNVAPLTTAPTNPVFRWNAVTGAEVYRIIVDDTTNGARVIDVSPTTSDANCASGPPAVCAFQAPSLLVAGRAYTWSVLTWNSTNFIGCWSFESSFTVNASGLAAPVLIFPNGDVTNPVTFSWYALAAATSYRLVVDDGDTLYEVNTNYTAAAAGCPTGSGICSVTVPNTLANGTGRWLVRASNAIGVSPYSPAMYFTIGAVGRATAIAPSGAIATNQPTYSWAPAANATQYLLYVSDSATVGKVQLYVTAAAAGCAGGAGTCSVTPATALVSGPANWTVQANGGLWSIPKMAFTVP